jgi:predicted AAA+ superfamily ATPase
MYRTAMEYLKEWKTRSNRKPLIIRGARQVGKSHLVRDFAKQEFTTFAEINLDEDLSVVPYFDKLDPRETLRLLELHFETTLEPGRTLLFIDEIQAAPQLLAKLRYFYEKLPDLHVIAAGSLLDFTLEQHDFSMPVGRIEYLHLGPMGFSEFLLATGHEQACAFLKAFKIGDDIPEPLHNKLSDLLVSYIVVGGMPESVKAFAERKSYRECDFIKSSILATYKEDFSKYGRKVNLQHILTVYEALPNLVDRKVKYVNISRDIRSRDLSQALQMLALARVCHLVYHASCNGIPLSAEMDKHTFKPLFLDVGLLLNANGLSMTDIPDVEALMLVNSGQICEQFVGQHLLYRQELYKQPELHYWLREKPSSNAEVDYVIASGQRIVPIEVKAGKTGNLRSLHQFTIEKGLNFAIKICTERPSLVKASGKMPDGRPYDSHILSLPFYLIEKLACANTDFLKDVVLSIQSGGTLTPPMEE